MPQDSANPGSNPGSGASAAASSGVVATAVATSLSQPGDLAAGVELAPATALRRIPFSADVLAPADATQAAAFQQNRLQAVGHFYLTLNAAANQIAILGKLLTAPTTPDQLVGTLLEPDGTAAARVQAQIDVAQLGIPGGGHQITLTDDHGAFMLPLPSGRPFPANGLSLTIHGANTNATINLAPTQIAANGLVGNSTLPTRLDPLPVSIIASLQALLPANGTAQQGQPAPAPPQLPQVTLGDNGQCQLSFQTNYSVDRFPFSVFFRLVEPRTSIVTEVFRVPVLQDGAFSLFTKWDLNLTLPGTIQSSYVDRSPVEQPISVDGFRDQIIGVDGSNPPTVGVTESVPMAGTLGLGYVLRVAQLWSPKGYALGDLVYSLPLAPGEQEEVAIFERTDTASVRESELLSDQEQQTLFQTSDASSEATFTSAFNEMTQGGSQFQTDASSSSWGASIIIASGGGGSSSSGGNSSEWMSGQRDQVQQAAEDSHSAVARQAAARRDTFRTSMRLASATESESVTTKTITNHNHTRALTLQYWEVLRLFNITTDIEGAELCCLVPLEVVRFLPPGQVLLLDTKHLPTGRDAVLNRYALVLKHADVLARSLPREFQYGLTLLRQFASDPTADVQTAASAAEDVINFSLSGTFLPFEQIYVSAVTRRGTRLGPVRLAGQIDPIPDVHTDLKNSFPTRDALLGYLRSRRDGGSILGLFHIGGQNYSLAGNLAIPPSLARNDIIGFELTRNFQPLDYDLVNQQVQTAVFLGITLQITSDTQLVSSTIHFSPQDLESELGGPILGNFTASLLAISGGGAGPDPKETYANDDLSGVELPPATYPVPAVQLTPVLKYSQLLEIEKMLQHVVRNTIVYSKAVWWSLTPEERAIMLEGYTIGVPTGGITDESQMVPLLNCVQNTVLGFYGNSMIMPFIIPASVAESMNITSSQVQQMLTQFHKAAFDPPESTIALPTRGVLGEAVLGHCSSAEKIDLTRFWNWQDSPADTAPQISPVTLPTTTPSIAAGLTAPNTLTGMPPLINNFNASGGATSPDTSLLTSMIQAAAGQKDFSTDITGASQLAPLILNTQKTAESARADALKTTKDLTAQAIATAGDLVGGKMGNPNAGSNALAAQSGQTPKSASGGSGSGTGTGTGGSTGGKGGGTGSGGSGGSGSGGSGSGSSGGGGSSGSGSGGSGSGGSGSGGGG
ncbi:MAG: hypothetical protein ACRD3D_13600 [Terriglobia bacterium]